MKFTIIRVQNGWILITDADRYGPQYVYNRAEDLLKDLAVALVEPQIVDKPEVQA